MKEKSKVLAKKLINSTPALKELAVGVYGWMNRRRYQNIKKHTPTEEKTVVFESFLGRQYGCSPKALFLEMVRDPAYAEYTKLWMFTRPEKYKSLEKYPGTKVIKYGSGEFYQGYARAKYWVTNYHLPSGIKKEADQVYIQTWHGTPLKKIGCDVPDNGTLTADRKRAYKEYAREGQIIDFLPSPSPFYTEKITSAFRLGAQAKILELGYPRNDALFTGTEKKCRKIREKLGIPQDKHTILYAPTWRDDQHTAGTGYTYRLGLDFDALKKNLGKDWVILFRAHYLISNGFDFEKYQGFVRDVSQYDDINDLYLVSDMLLTDYSSVFFDYANLMRPMLFYMYDYENYKNQLRDFYFDAAELPGPVITEEKEISEDILKLWKDFSYDEKYRRFNEKFNPVREACSKKILEEILRPDRQGVLDET